MSYPGINLFTDIESCRRYYDISQEECLNLYRRQHDISQEECLIAFEPFPFPLKHTSQCIHLGNFDVDTDINDLDVLLNSLLIMTDQCLKDCRTNQSNLLFRVLSRKRDCPNKYMWHACVNGLNLDASLRGSMRMFIYHGWHYFESCQQDQSQLLIQFYRIMPGWEKKIIGGIQAMPSDETILI